MSEKTCSICGKGTLHKEVGDFKSHFEDRTGALREVVVKGVTKFRCDKCNEALVAGDDEARISVAQRQALGLLTAADLEAFRKGLSNTQEGMAELLGIGKKTYCRWESIDYFQSEAFDRMVRLLMAEPRNVQLLQEIAAAKHPEQRPAAKPVRSNPRFAFIADVAITEAHGAEFAVLLNSGTLLMPANAA